MTGGLKVLRSPTDAIFFASSLLPSLQSEPVETDQAAGFADRPPDFRLTSAEAFTVMRPQCRKSILLSQAILKWSV
jgi:hypothetical protein